MLPSFQISASTQTSQQVSVRGLVNDHKQQVQFKIKATMVGANCYSRKNVNKA
jgi:hypothetical protein